jgi:hypothetical protein
MKFIPRHQPEKFSLPSFLMENIIIFFIAALMAFIVPLFVARRASTEVVNKVLSMYNNHGHTRELEVVCMIVGAAVALVFCVIRLNKFYNFRIEIVTDQLESHFINMRGQTMIRKIDLKGQWIGVEYVGQTQGRPDDVEIALQNGTVVLSTRKEKYWDLDRDWVVIQELISALKKMEGKPV